MVDPLTLLLLGGVGLVAGFIDAVAGGGGLIALPALMSTGMPPLAALATNKLQGVVGTFTSTLTYWRKGHIDLRRMLFPVIATFAGAFLGAFTVKKIDVTMLGQLVPIALIAIAVYFLLAPKISDEARVARVNIAYMLPIFGFLIGFYDGVFGPGTGSILTIGFVALFGFGMLKASANTKLLNFTSNLAALVLFISAGDVIWAIGLVMGMGQLIGGYLGALTGMRFGAKLIRPLVVAVSIAMALNLLFVG